MTTTSFRFMRATCAIFLAATLVVTPALARAQDAATADAREHYKAAQELFSAGKYRQAIERLRQAYDLKPHPMVLRQIGRAYAKLGDADNAIGSFRQYLAEAPDAPDRAEIEDAIRELEQAGESGATAAPPARDEEENPIDSALSQREGDDVEAAKPKPWHWLKWTALSVGGSAVLMSLIFRSQAASAQSDLEGYAHSPEDIQDCIAQCPDGIYGPDGAVGGNDDCNDPCVKENTYNKAAFDAEEKRDKMNMLFGVSLGIGLASLAASGVFFYLDHKTQIRTSVEAEEEGRIILLPSIEPAGLFSEVRF